MDKKIRFGTQLRAIRKQRGLTQEELAEMIDRSVDAVSNMERGISLPSYETLGRLADKLGIPAKELTESLGDDGTTDPERIELEARLNDIARSLDKQSLRIALEQIAVLAKGNQR
ncbi:MAG: helix-turn-helix transcriptional regulator [Alphaproteobacteria bacterium]|nr:helix-turn-helix transcriptional regulator [Alphaproteobacteria bacterium]